VKYLLTIIMMLVIVQPAYADQGVYYSGSDPAALDYIKSTGFTFVIGSPSPALETGLRERGLGAYWSTPIGKFKSFDYANSPVTRGWYVADEPQPPVGGQLREWVKTISTIDNRPTLSVHWGCSPAQARETMLPFKDGASWMGTDCYPVGVNSSRLVGPAFQSGNRTASKLGKTFWAVTQAASWAEMCGEACGRPETAWPSVREMQIMRDCAQAANAKLIVWYSLNDVMQGGPRRMSDLATAVHLPHRKCPKF